jgi:hypothetical protein
VTGSSLLSHWISAALIYRVVAIAAASGDHRNHRRHHGRRARSRSSWCWRYPATASVLICAASRASSGACVGQLCFQPTGSLLRPQCPAAFPSPRADSTLLTARATARQPFRFTMRIRLYTRMFTRSVADTRPRSASGVHKLTILDNKYVAEKIGLFWSIIPVHNELHEDHRKTGASVGSSNAGS